MDVALPALGKSAHSIDSSCGSVIARRPIRPRTTSHRAHVASTSGRQRSRLSDGTSTEPLRSAAPVGAPPILSATALKPRSDARPSFCTERRSSSVGGRRLRFAEDEEAGRSPTPSRPAASSAGDSPRCRRFPLLAERPSAASWAVAESEPSGLVGAKGGGRQKESVWPARASGGVLTCTPCSGMGTLTRRRAPAVQPGGHATCTAWPRDDLASTVSPGTAPMGKTISSCSGGRCTESRSVCPPKAPAGIGIRISCTGAPSRGLGDVTGRGDVGWPAADPPPPPPPERPRGDGVALPLPGAFVVRTSPTTSSTPVRPDRERRSSGLRAEPIVGEANPSPARGEGRLIGCGR